MNTRPPINLIPRNNWDFGLDALASSLAGVRRNDAQEQALDRIFQQQPVWTNSGRTSLYAILKALELPEGAKIGVPLYCCSVVFDAICKAGCSPFFIDSNLSDLNISSDDLQRKRTDIEAVVAVHMFGNPCDMDVINACMDPLPVIEDCAQSLFSRYKGKLTGTLSTASFFSFRCGKYISAGEGSAILFNDSILQNKVDQITASFKARSPAKLVIDALLTFIKATLYNRPWYGLIGYPVGMRLDKKLNLTAKEGFITEKIAPTYLSLITKRIIKFQEKIEKQRERAQLLLGSIIPTNIVLPAESKDCYSNWFQFPLKFQSTHQRDEMAEILLQKGIDTSKYLDGIVDEAREKYGYHGGCPNSELLSKTVLLIPMYYSLKVSDIDYISRSINEGLFEIQRKATQ